MGEPLLGVDSVVFSYPGVAVIKVLNLLVREGEMVGFIGANGSGKTTTFLLATGFLRPESGRISVFGENPSLSSGWKMKVGVVLARAGHYGRLTVKRNLKFFADLYGVETDLDRHLASHGLQEFAQRQVRHLSTGTRQKLTMARATVHSPQLLLLDEPSDGLDPKSTEELHLYLRKFVEEGGSVLLTSHRLDEVEALCSRVSVLHQGRIVVSGEPSELDLKKEGGLKQLLRDCWAGGEEAFGVNPQE